MSRRRVGRSSQNNPNQAALPFTASPPRVVAFPESKETAKLAIARREARGRMDSSGLVPFSLSGRIPSLSRRTESDRRDGPTEAIGQTRTPAALGLSDPMPDRRRRPWQTVPGTNGSMARARDGQQDGAIPRRVVEIRISTSGGTAASHSRAILPARPPPATGRRAPALPAPESDSRTDPRTCHAQAGTDHG